MKELYEEDILKIVQDASCNLLAEAVTPMHAYGVEAALLKLKDKGIQLKGLILIMPHPVSGIALGSENFPVAESMGIECAVYKGKRHKRNIMEKITTHIRMYGYFGIQKNRKIENWLFYLKPLRPNFFMLSLIGQVRNVMNIVTEEGLGSYLATAQTWIDCVKREQGRKWVPGTYIEHKLRNPFFLCCLKRKHQIIYFRLLEAKESEFVLNKEAIKCFQMAIDMQKGREDFEDYANAIVICGDILKEQKILLNDKDLEIYKAICDYAESKGIPVIFKAHPRTQNLKRYEGFKWRIDKRYEIGIEAIAQCLKVKPLCLVGVDTTAVISCKVLYDIEGISINKIIGNEGFYTPTRCKRFNEVFEKVIAIPEKSEELIDWIGMLYEEI